MTVQTQHTDFNTAVMEQMINNRAAISVTNPDATPLFVYVVSITPSSSSSNVLINVNCHIRETTNDGKYYGLDYEEWVYDQGSTENAEWR